LRDVETISLALTAAETGHLVLATLHTRGAVSAVNRMIDVFPARQQQQARAMLAESLTAVISQELVRRNAGGRAPCVEVLTGTPAVRALIREGKTHQIESVMQTSASSGMRTRAAAMEALIREQSCIQIEPECSGSNRFERIV
jgi:twitching motility protein PilT